MGRDELNVIDVPISDLKPYENNPRVNDNSIDAVANSIKNFGFKVPLVIDNDSVIVCGHTRLRAAQKLGLESVPCIVADDLTPEQIKAFRLADNKVAELSEWDNVLLACELEELAAADIDMADFAFDTSENWMHQQAWKKAEKYCDLKKKIKCHSHGGFFTTCFFEVGKKGIPITEIKENPDNVKIFAECLADFIFKSLGANLTAGNWCILTTPRRRHKDGMHFSTEICKLSAEMLKIPFYVDCFTAENRDRINPTFHMEKTPQEINVILFDDIISTGVTIKTCRQLLIDSGYVVHVIIGIKNSTFGK